MTPEPPPRISPTLLGFLEPLTVREPRIFEPFMASLKQSSAAVVDEQRIRYLLADHAVRVCAAEALRFENCALEADRLRALPSVEDDATASSAAAAVRAAHGLESAALAAQDATLSAAHVNDPGFVGEQAAYAVLALADFYVEPTGKHHVFSAAIRLVARQVGIDADAATSHALD